jgi:hypothetical protein
VASPFQPSLQDFEAGAAFSNQAGQARNRRNGTKGEGKDFHHNGMEAEPAIPATHPPRALILFGQ